MCRGELSSLDAKDKSLSYRTDTAGLILFVLVDHTLFYVYLLVGYFEAYPCGKWIEKREYDGHDENKRGHIFHVGGVGSPIYKRIEAGVEKLIGRHEVERTAEF